MDALNGSGPGLKIASFRSFLENNVFDIGPLFFK